jgi:hypothetical protein
MSLQLRTFVTTQRNKNRALDVLASDCAVRACRKKEQTEDNGEDMLGQAAPKDIIRQ